ncbi:hypothetical protein EAF00_001861 [Botryotinia globosa]|nr:hypothetical protein EAF00_001861 [Botryotinia globosa]
MHVSKQSNGVNLPRPAQNFEDVLPLPLSMQHSKPIESLAGIAKLDDKDTPVITIFSDGLDSTYLLLRLQELGLTNIHAVQVDVGAPVDVDGLTKHAAHFGAQFKCLDGPELFVRDGVVPAILAHVMYLGQFPISSSLTRLIVARLVADYANYVNAGLLLHTANLSQNTLPRLNNFIQRLGYPGKFGSPHPQSVVSREKKAEELSVAGLSIMSKRKLSGDENLWCREFEDDPLDDPEGFRTPENVYEWTRRYKEHATQELTLGLENGNLISVDGKKHPLIRAIALLNSEVLEVHEAPAAAIIMDALRHLEIATLESKTQSRSNSWNRNRLGKLLRIIGEARVITCVMGVAIAATLNEVGGTATYVIDSVRFLSFAIKAQNLCYVRDRDQWEEARKALGEISAPSKLIYQQDGNKLLHPAKILSIIPVSALPDLDQAFLQDSSDISHALITNSTIPTCKAAVNPSTPEP